MAKLYYANEIKPGMIISWVAAGKAARAFGYAGKVVTGEVKEAPRDNDIEVYGELMVRTNSTLLDGKPVHQNGNGSVVPLRKIKLARS